MDSAEEEFGSLDPDLSGMLLHGITTVPSIVLDFEDTIRTSSSLNEHMELAKGDLERIEVGLKHFPMPQFIDVLTACDEKGLEKDVATALSLKIQGDVYVDKPDSISDWNLGIRAYNMAMNFAPTDSVVMAEICLARASVFLDNKDRHNSLKDIEMGLRCKGLSATLMRELLERQMICLSIGGLIEQNFDNVKLQSYYDEVLFEIQGERNESIPVAKDCLFVDFSEEKGRHVCCTEEFKTGTTVTVESPYVSVLNGTLQWQFKNCHKCLKKTARPIPCPHCVFKSYCSEECKIADWNEGHWYECACLPYLHSAKISSSFLMGFKALCKAGPRTVIEFYKMEPLKLFGKEWHTKGLDPKTGTYLNSYYQICNLYCHHRDSDVVCLVWTAISCAKVLDEKTPFFQSVSNQVEKERVVAFAASLLLRHFVTFRYNAISMLGKTELQKSPGDPDDTAIATVLYSFISIFGHSCAPNLTRVTAPDGTMAIVTNRKIFPGEELCVNYGWTYNSYPLEVRASNLLSRFQTKCTCLACELDWSSSSAERSTEFFCPKCSQDFDYCEKAILGQTVLVAMNNYSDTRHCQECLGIFSLEDLTKEKEHYDNLLSCAADFISTKPLNAIPSLINCANYYSSRIRPPCAELIIAQGLLKRAYLSVIKILGKKTLSPSNRIVDMILNGRYLIDDDVEEATDFILYPEEEETETEEETKKEKEDDEEETETEVETETAKEEEDTETETETAKEETETGSETETATSSSGQLLPENFLEIMAFMYGHLDFDKLESFLYTCDNELKKNDYLSCLLKKRGDEFAQFAMFNKALRCYNLSALFFEEQDDRLELELESAKSHLLSKMKDIPYSATDIEIATYYNERCWTSEGKVEVDFYFEDSDEEENEFELNRQQTYCKNVLFEVQEPSLEIQSSSKSLEIRYNDVVGRHVVAKEDVKTGTTIIVEDPYVSLLKNITTWETRRCGKCFKRTRTLTPCPSCVFVSYCSVKCREDDYNGGHRYECHCLPYLHGIQITANLHIGFRIICKTGPFELYRRFQELTPPPDSNTIQGFNPDTGVYESNSYHQICQLKHHMTLEITEAYTAHALSLVSVLDSRTTFFNIAKSEPDRRNFIIFVSSMLIQHYAASPVNSMSLGEESWEEKIVRDGSDSDTYKFKGSKDVLIEYLSALYSLITLISHGCDPNAHRYHLPNGTMAIVTNRPLKAGEEIFVSYGWSFTGHELESRSAALENSYYFSCTCNPCIYKWPLFEHLTDEEYHLCPRCTTSKAELKFSDIPAIVKYILDPVGTTETLLCKMCNKEYATKDLDNLVQSHSNLIVYAYNSLLPNYPIEAVELLRSAIDYFHTKTCPPSKHLLVAQGTLQTAHRLMISNVSQ